MVESLLSYLRLLAGPEPGARLLEVRYRTAGQPGMGQRFIPASTPERAVEAITRLADRGDTYVGVLLRDRHAGGRQAVSGSHLLWVELDATDAYQRLRHAPARPTAIVASGTPGHLHAYWQLTTPVPAVDVPELNRRLAGTVGGDLASVDAARILRPPGTLNHKHQPATATRLELLDPARRYDPAALTAGLPDPRPKPVYVPPANPRPRPSGRGPWWRVLDEQLRQIPAREYVQRLSGEELTAEGKIHCPFHADGRERTPSLQIYEPYEWACFGCQRGGSIYDFASHLYGIPTKGASFRLLRDLLADLFALGVGETPRPTRPHPVPAGTTHR